MSDSLHLVPSITVYAAGAVHRSNLTWLAAALAAFTFRFVFRTVRARYLPQQQSTSRLAAAAAEAAADTIIA